MTVTLEKGLCTWRQGHSQLRQRGSRHEGADTTLPRSHGLVWHLLSCQSPEEVAPVSDVAASRGCAMGHPSWRAREEPSQVSRPVTGTCPGPDAPRRWVGWCREHAGPAHGTGGAVFMALNPQTQAFTQEQSYPGPCTGHPAHPTPSPKFCTGACLRHKRTACAVVHAVPSLPGRVRVREEWILPRTLMTPACSTQGHRVGA